MENIDLYDLAFAFSQRPEVSDARVATDMCPDDTVLVEFTNGQVAVLNMQDGYPAVALGMLYANADGIREYDPLESVHHDFEGEDDYGDGVGDLIAQCTGGVTTMDTVEFFRDRKWPSTDSRILEIPVAGLGNVAVQDWSMPDDVRFAGYLLPEPLRNRYFGLLEQDATRPRPLGTRSWTTCGRPSTPWGRRSRPTGLEKSTTPPPSAPVTGSTTASNIWTPHTPCRGMSDERAEALRPAKTAP